MRRILFRIGILTLIARTPAVAQSAGTALTVGLSFGVTSFGGAAVAAEVQSDNLRAMPFRPSMLGLAVSYGGRGVRLGFSAAYGEPGLAIRGTPGVISAENSGALLIVADNAFKLAAFSATLSTRFIEFAKGPSLRPSLGVLLERWSSPGAPTHTILGGLAGLLLELPLTRSLSGVLAGNIGYTPGSPFHAAVVPEGFKTQSTWRREVTGGIMLKL